MGSSRRVIASLAAAALLSRAHAQHEHHAHEHDPGAQAHDAPIKITINPEARVSVSRGGALPPPSPCGRPIELPVHILNHGYLTAPLVANLVPPVPAGVALDFAATPLSGRSTEQRTLRITLQVPGPVDITIAFRPRNDMGDLGGRDRIHLLIRCLPAQSS